MSDFEANLRREVAERGEMDWVSMAELCDIARSLGAENPRQAAVDFAVAGTDEGILAVGEYINGRSFVRWPERGESLRHKILAGLASSPAEDPLCAEMSIMVDPL
ncbi:hypothetical protein [Kocuria tytonis]|uniref:Uncharacterized protein n=1 Tax=Kocuria tytonis TaxID=2054280 RepID=A0A495A677_9MICC|nr:hypothetical protein [Kocuria tytonis]RKQ35321.1 hypothetical protein C1C97_008845 [Kocuria tytonis]